VSIGTNRDWPERKFVGSIAEVRIWSGATPDPPPVGEMFRPPSEGAAGLVGHVALSEAEFQPPLSAQKLRRISVAPPPIQGFGSTTAPPGTATPPTPVDPTVELNATIARLEAPLFRLESMYGQATIRMDQLGNAARDEADRAARAEARLQEVLEDVGKSETTLDGFVKQVNERVRKARSEVASSGSPYRLGRRVTADTMTLSKGDERMPDLSEVRSFLATGDGSR
jgi:hypothetical protein